MSTRSRYGSSHGLSYDLSHLRHELDKSRVLFEPKSAATPLPQPPQWRSSVSGLQAVSPSTWAAATPVNEPADSPVVDTSAMATDCGHMEAVFAQSIDWEKVANILAAKLESAMQDSVSAQNERDLMCTQLGRLEQIVEAHAKAALESAAALHRQNAALRNSDAQTTQTGDVAGSIKAELDACRKQNLELQNALHLNAQELAHMRQRSEEQESTLEELALRTAEQEEQLAEASASKKALNTELAENQGVILNLKQQTKSLKRKLRNAGPAPAEAANSKVQDEPSTEAEFVDDNGSEDEDPKLVVAGTGFGSTGFGSG